VAREPAADEVEGLDEEFLYHLNRGADLLSGGELEPARGALARARDLRPRDPQVLGLLGQSLYKLGRYDEAADVYGALVAESPAEAAARVNLGLANLKARRWDAAVRELTVALDLNPGHKKAMGYLGLAHLEQGDAARARDWFERAGSEQMVARCDELLAAAKAGRDGAAAPAPAAKRAVAIEELAADEVAGDEGPGPLRAAPEPIEEARGGADADVDQEEPDAIAFAAEPIEAPQPAPGGRALATSRLDDVPAVTPAAVPYGVAGGLLAIAVGPGGVLARSEGLVAAQGALDLAPEPKRFRGRATEKPFGEGPRRVLKAVGEGVLYYAPGDATFVALELAGASAYVREELVFALDGTVAYENGRLASRAGPDLNLVHARGEGRVVVATRGDVRAVEVRPAMPVRVPLDALVGWTGALTPRIGALAGPPEAAPAAGELFAVELSGEGRVLVDTGATAHGRR
jgi:uncharacterized protein (AIM24 family)